MREYYHTPDKPSYNHIIMTTANLSVIFLVASGFHRLGGGGCTYLGGIPADYFFKKGNLMDFVGNGYRRIASTSELSVRLKRHFTGAITTFKNRII
jgi:hypothetical protein